MYWWQILLIVLVGLGVLIGLSALFYKQFFKRFYDILLSGLAIIVLSPLLIVLTVVGAIAMGGNPFFVQPRPGRINPHTGNEKIFRMIKFRSMSNKKDKDGNLLPDAQRLNRYGKFLRATSLDELPELFTILCGNMSIVGPRPQLVRDMVFMTPEQRKRHTVTPGLTGLAQVSGRNNISWEKKFEYDIEYISQRVSFGGDLHIIFMTIGKVIKKSDVVREGTESDMDFGDWLLSEGKVDSDSYSAKQTEALQILKEAGF